MYGRGTRLGKSFLNFFFNHGILFIMKRKDQKSMWRRFFESRLFLVCSIVILVFVIMSYARAYYEDYEVRQKIQELEKQVQSLEGKKLESLQILQYVKSDNFIEEKARTELNLKKPGESVVFVEGVIPTQVPQATNETAPVDEPTLSNPMKWWYYFSHQKGNE